MRDLGTLVWVVLVFVGVVSSMISTIRKQARAQRPAARPAPPGASLRFVVPPPSPAAPQVAPPPQVQAKPTLQPEPRPPVHPADDARAKRGPFFAGKGQLARAVIAAEVLGKPRGLRDEHFPR